MIHGSPEGRLKLLARHLKGRRPTSSSGMSPITTHVLDTAKGTPAMGLPISLEYLGNGAVETVAAGVTNDDGRIPGFMDSQAELRGGLYRMTFNTAAYYERLGEAFFYPEVVIQFMLPDTPDDHYHIPLLLSPFGYSTYRGS
mmetsp:Transcript_41950/g.131460  ORF Transcript_41950/g.131460 Transcript_41950/m.131460 type:complete len:142 (-) Transcript_41950:136-561(-)